jgi:hypothetical protein
LKRNQVINAGTSSPILKYSSGNGWITGKEGKLMSRVCPTCPYKWVIAQRISMRTHLKRKEVDDVLGGKDSWANVDVVDGESEFRMSSVSWARFRQPRQGMILVERDEREKRNRADISNMPCM